MAVRLPSEKAYEPKVQKEAKWLPVLEKSLTLPITKPIAKGQPTAEYPFAWSINKNNINLLVFAEELASFLKDGHYGRH